MFIPYSFIKYIVAFNVVYWPVRQVARDGVAVALAFATWPVVWWVARRRRRNAFYEGVARQRLAERAQLQEPAPETLD